LERGVIKKGEYLEFFGENPFLETNALKKRMQMEDSQEKERGNCSCELVEKEEEEE
jgi:hypothetical protein